MAGPRIHEEGLVPRREAAQIAGVHPNTIRLWERTGRLHAKKHESGVVLIDVSELEGIMGERRAAAGSGDDATKVAALEAENRQLRAELDMVREEKNRMLEAIIQVAEKRGDER